MTGVRVFGDGPDGPVHEITLTAADGTSAAVITFGAVVRDLMVPAGDGGPRSVVLGFDQLEPYQTNPAYLGAVAGRYANRIARGRFVLDGAPHQLPLNEHGRTHLHGGTRGFSHRNWSILDHGRDRVSLGLTSPDGEEGYPGTLEAVCTYRLSPPATLRVEFAATTDRPTIVNLAQHSYFALEPGKTVRDLVLTVDADRFTPVDGDLIPTGEIAPVDGTPFDFRTPRRIGDGGTLYDINFALSKPAGRFGRAARVESSHLALEVWTGEPGLQVYDGHLLKPEQAPPGLGFPHAGLCLETQTFPDSPNHPHFPSPILRPGERREQVTEYRFLRA